jgi:hypothetical protein
MIKSAFERCKIVFIVFTFISAAILILPTLRPFKSNVNGGAEIPDLISQSKQSGGKIKRLAIFRPFGKKAVDTLTDMFSSWEDHIPCNMSMYEEDDNFFSSLEPSVFVDIFLSYSQSYENYPPAQIATNKIINDFIKRRSYKGWPRCIHNISTIDANIIPEIDLYLPEESQTNRMWVHGPNYQFVHGISQIMSLKQYDAVFVMEGDVLPVRDYWLDTLIKEAEEDEFVILGSKYDGRMWDSFRTGLPLALQHHINGNAVYNLSHPLLEQILIQLRKESDLPLHAIPYDYRISQILVEGMMGVLPEVPSAIEQAWSKETGQQMKSNTKNFQYLWEKYAKSEQRTIKESSVITNYAGSTLLPHQLQKQEASLVHGASYYSSLNKSKYVSYYATKLMDLTIF